MSLTSRTSPERGRRKRYEVFRLEHGGRRELVSDTDLRNQAESLPALYSATLIMNGLSVAYVSVESRTGVEVARHEPEEPFPAWVLLILGVRADLTGRAA